MVEILGWLANIFFFSGGLFKSTRATMLQYGIGNILYIIMYCFMGLYTAVLSMGLTTLRQILSAFLPDKQNKITSIILTALACVVMAFSLENYLDSILLVAAICIGAACYYRDNAVTFRLLICLSNFIWIIHSLVFGVYSMIFCCSIIIATNLWTLIKHTEIKSPFIEKVKEGYYKYLPSRG
ncbi:MAG: YgjV family protein [Alphaproteobacteria bacterium]|nr:YgjV family protein [Alphaproteobacteria bacterium]